jgi:hypothetical protein
MAMGWIRRAACVVIVLSAVGVACSRSGADGRHKVDGLTDDLYVRLCGTWDRFLGVQKTPGTFSWGTARHVSNGSVDIDLGAVPPFLAAPWGLFQIRSVSETVTAQYLPKMVWKQAGVAERDILLVVHLNQDGSMWWEPNGIMGQGKDVPYYRLDGPKKLK